MQVTVSEISPVEKKVAVEIPWPYVCAEARRRLQGPGKGVALKGFRKGKVPRPMLEQMFGRQVEQEVVKQLVQESFFTAAKSMTSSRWPSRSSTTRTCTRGSRSTTRRASKCAARSSPRTTTASSWGSARPDVSDEDVDRGARAQAPGADRVQARSKGAT